MVTKTYKTLRLQYTRISSYLFKMGYMKTSLFSSHIPTKSALLTSNTYSQISIPNLTPNPHFKLTMLPALTPNPHFKLTTLPALPPNLTLEPHLNTWNFEDSLPKYVNNKLSLLEAVDSPYSYLATNFMTMTTTRTFVNFSQLK